VIAADRQAITVAGHHPYVEVRVGQLDPRGERRRTAVDRVKPIAFDVIGKAARAADPADEHGVRRICAQLRQCTLHGLEDRVVPAARAPADFLVALPVLESGLNGGHVVHGCTLLCGERRSGLSDPSSWPDSGSGNWPGLNPTSPPSLFGMPSK